MARTTESYFEGSDTARRILTGTDAPIRNSPPGFGLQDSLPGRQ